MADVNGILRYISINSTEKARAFSERIISTKYEIKGMQSPAARVLTKEVMHGKYGTPAEVLTALPDDSYESVALQGAVIGALKIPFENKKPLIDAFVLKIDNWATNDSFVSAIKIPRAEEEKYYNYFVQYAKGEGEFPVRFGIISLMSKFLTDNYVDDVLENVKGIDGAYYVRMAVAWTLATSLAKYYDKTLPILENGEIADAWTHNKAIRKAIESYRISDEQKAYLRTLKR